MSFPPKRKEKRSAPKNPNFPNENESITKMSQGDSFGLLLFAPAAVSKKATVIKDLKQQDCEIVYEEQIRLDVERAKKFLELYSKPSEEEANRKEDTIARLTEDSCLALVVKKKQLSTTLKQLFEQNNVSVDEEGGGGENTEENAFSTKYGFPSDLIYYCTDKENAKECIDFLFPNRKCLVDSFFLPVF